MAGSYIEYADATGVTINETTYVRIAMTTPTDAPALVLPSSGVQWSHVEIGLYDADGTGQINATKVFVFLSWDSLGIQTIAGPTVSAIDIHKVDFDSKSYASCVIDLGITPTFPASNPAGTAAPERGVIYCHVKADAGTDDTVILARLHWNEISKG